jgi:alpha-aminoadipate carrier protein LysW
MPECDATLNLKEVVQGEIVQCPDCGVDLEVVSVNPLQLEVAPMEEGWGDSPSPRKGRDPTPLPLCQERMCKGGRWWVCCSRACA